MGYEAPYGRALLWNGEMSEEAVRSAFPEPEAIEDEDLRAGVITTWTVASGDNDVGDLTARPWFQPAQRELDIADEGLVDHTRDVTACVVALAETRTE